MKNTYKIVNFLVFTLFISFSMSGQSIWDGSGDGTSWDDPLNWEDDLVPSEGAFVVIAEDAVITGTANNPQQVKVNANKDVTFNLDLTIGEIDSEEHGVIVGKKSNITFGPYNFDISTANNKQGVTAFASSDSAQVTVMTDASLSFNNCANGINIVAPHTSFTNNGSIEFNANCKTGIKSGGLFNNKGQITIPSLINDGISVIGQQFSNDSTGVIEISKCGDDGIAVIDDAMMQNYGMISIVVKDDAGSANNGVSIGTADTLGIFLNMGNGHLQVDGGLSEIARAVAVLEFGVFNNAGLVTLSGGNEGARIHSRNILVNDKNGVIDLTDGRITINMGTMRNNGYVKSERDGAGIFSAEGTTLINNGFFKYMNSSNFASGMGTIEENGIKVNQFSRAKLDASGECQIDIAEESYDWFLDGELYATSNSEGLLTFAENSIPEDSVQLVTTIPEIAIRVINICDDAVMTTATEEVSINQTFSVYPTVVNSGYDINIQSANNSIYHLNVFDIAGNLLNTQSFQNFTTINTDLMEGILIIRIFNDKEVSDHKVSVLK